MTTYFITGGLGFRLVVLRGDAGAEAERRFYRVAGIGVIGALEVGIVAFLLRAQDALQLPFTSFLYGDLAPFATATRFGEAFVAMELGFSIVAGHPHCGILPSQQLGIEAFVDKFLLGNTAVNTDIHTNPWPNIDTSYWTEWWGTGKREFSARDRSGSQVHVCLCEGLAKSIRLHARASRAAAAWAARATNPCATRAPACFKRACGGYQGATNSGCRRPSVWVAATTPACWSFRKSR